MTMINLNSLNSFDRGKPENPEDGFEAKGAGQFDLLFSALSILPQSEPAEGVSENDADIPVDALKQDPDISKTNVSVIEGTATVTKSFRFEFNPANETVENHIPAGESKDINGEFKQPGTQPSMPGTQSSAPNPSAAITKQDLKPAAIEQLSFDSDQTIDTEAVKLDSTQAGFDPVEAAKQFEFVLPGKSDTSFVTADEGVSAIFSDTQSNAAAGQERAADPSFPTNFSDDPESIDSPGAAAEIQGEVIGDIDAAGDTTAAPVPIDVSQTAEPNPFLRSRTDSITETPVETPTENPVLVPNESPEYFDPPPMHFEIPTETVLASRPGRVDPASLPDFPTRGIDGRVLDSVEPGIFPGPVDYEPQVTKPDPELPVNQIDPPTADAPEPVKADPVIPGFWEGPILNKHRYLNSLPPLMRPQPVVDKTDTPVKQTPGPVETPPIVELPGKFELPVIKTEGTTRIQGIPLNSLNNAKFQEHQYVRESNEFIDTGETPAAKDATVEDLFAKTGFEKPVITETDVPILKKATQETGKITEAIFKKFAIDSESAINETDFAAFADAEPVIDQIEKPVLEMSKTIIENGEPTIFKFKLKPAELGSVEIRIEKNSNGDLSLEFHAESEMASHLLRESFDHLKHKLEDAGFNIDDIQSFNQPASEQSFTQQQRGAQRENSHNPAAHQRPESKGKSENQDPNGKAGDETPERLLSVMA